uniref:Uncharacterized protein n=1 Tax=Plectus sambesii TaxID=2011161 RepID=A0A914VRL7_9BILA
MTTKSKKGVGPRRNTGDADAFGSAAKKRRRHTSGFEDDPQSSDYFYKPVTSRSATKEEANAASESPPSLEASVVVGPLTTDGDRRRKSRSRAPASPSPIADQQATHEHRRSNSFDRHDSLRPKSNASCHTDAAPSAELPQPSTPPFDSFKDAMRQCTVPISPLEHKEVYIRLRQSEKKCHLPSRNEERKETSAGHNRLPNGFVSMNGSGGDVDRPAVNGNGQSLTKERHVSIEKVLKQPKTGGHPSVSPNGLNKQRESLLLSEEQKLKKIARKTLRSAACELSVFGAWPMSESQFSAPTRPPLSVRLSADEGRLIESDGVSADTLSIEDMEEKLADSAAPNGVELFNGDDRHYAEENERREQHERHAHRVPDHNDQRVDPLPL